MTDYVWLQNRRHRGWSFAGPESWHDIMFGEGNWCARCWVPNVPQSGPLRMASRDFRGGGIWTPYGPYDVICMADDIAREIHSRFDIKMLPILWHGRSKLEASQIVIPTVGSEWFDSNELESRLDAYRESKGNIDPQSAYVCAECGVSRWIPLPVEQHPPILILDQLYPIPIAAGPESYGSGGNSFRRYVVRRDLANYIATTAPRDFYITEINQSQ